MHTYVCVSGVRNVRFSKKFGVVSFLETPVLRFALLPYYRQILLLICQQWWSEKRCKRFSNSVSLYLFFRFLLLRWRGMEKQTAEATVQRCSYDCLGVLKIFWKYAANCLRTPTPLNNWFWNRYFASFLFLCECMMNTA